MEVCEGLLQRVSGLCLGWHLLAAQGEPNPCCVQSVCCVLVPVGEQAEDSSLLSHLLFYLTLKDVGLRVFLTT